MFRSRIWTVILLTVLTMSGCGSTAVEPVPNSNPPRRIEAASNTPGNILIRVNWVYIGNSVGDNDGVGEFQFDMLVKRRQERSVRLQYPGVGTHKISAGSSIPLDDFSLSVNQVRKDETILVCFMGFDDDAQNVWAKEATDSALDAAMALLEEGIRLGAEELVGKIPGGGFLMYLLDRLSGEALDYWREADVLGLYAFELKPSQNWMVGSSYEVKSDDGNMQVTFSVMADGSSDTVRNLESDPIAPESPVNVPPTSRPIVVAPTLRPTDVPPTARPSPIPTKPPSCQVSVYDGFRGIPNVKWEVLGCPRARASLQVWMAKEGFEGGQMIWREDTRQIYVRTSSGTWSAFADNWYEGQPELSCPEIGSSSPPAPKRGFGKVWCENPSVRKQLGWAQTEEQGFYGNVQDFQTGGHIVQMDTGRIFVFYPTGQWIEH